MNLYQGGSTEYEIQFTRLGIKGTLFFAQKYSIKKPDNFTNCLAILSGADFKLAETNDIYRTGIIGQFNITFELAWKALQEIMRISSGKRAAV